MDTNIILSFYCAVVVSTMGCFIGYLFKIKSLRFLIVDWILLVFVSTILMELFTFQNGNVDFKINFVLPLIYPFFSFTRGFVQVEAVRADYLIVGWSLAAVSYFFAWRVSDILISLQSFGFGFEEAFPPLLLGSLMCLAVSIWALQRRPAD